jgi:hypothetical protein
VSLLLHRIGNWRGWRDVLVIGVGGVVLGVGSVVFAARCLRSGYGVFKIQRLESKRLVMCEV